MNKDEALSFVTNMLREWQDSLKKIAALEAKVAALSASTNMASTQSICPCCMINDCCQARKRVVSTISACKMYMPYIVDGKLTAYIA